MWQGSRKLVLSIEKISLVRRIFAESSGVHQSYSVKSSSYSTNWVLTTASILLPILYLVYFTLYTVYCTPFTSFFILHTIHRLLDKALYTNVGFWWACFTVQFIVSRLHLENSPSFLASVTFFPEKYNKNKTKKLSYADQNSNLPIHMSIFINLNPFPVISIYFQKLQCISRLVNQSLRLGFRKSEVLCTSGFWTSRLIYAFPEFFSDINKCWSLIKTAKDCQRLIKITKNCKRLPEIAIDHQRSPKIAKYCQGTPKIAQDCEWLRNIAKYFKR